MSETNDYFNEYLGLLDEGESIQHYGRKRRSGRYPYGSGKDGLQRNASAAEKAVSEYDKLKAKGMADVDIAKKLGTTTTKMRSDRTIAKAERDQRTAESAGEGGTGDP